MTEAEQERARMLIPTQADREHGIEIGVATHRLRADLYGDAIRKGEWDQTEEIQLAAAHRNAALEEAARKATSFLVGDPKNGILLRSPGPHAIADAIRALKAPERGEHRKDGR